MPATVVVRGSGGTIFEMDVPTSGHALDAWNEKLVKGDLVIVEDEMSVEWFVTSDGARQLRFTEATEPTDGDEPTDATAPAKSNKGRRTPKVDATDTTDTTEE